MSKKDYKGNIAAEAWDNTKAENDPAFDNIREVGFIENLNFRAEKVKTTGVAITNFEKEVARIIAEQPKDESPMAVAEAPSSLDVAHIESVADAEAEAETVESLTKLKRDELDARAKAAGLDGDSYPNKEEVAKAILAAEAK